MESRDTVAYWGQLFFLPLTICNGWHLSSSSTSLVILNHPMENFANLFEDEVDVIYSLGSVAFVIHEATIS